ncbi:MAG: phosphate acyltransferase PlsX [Gammaproteobacteria bacterium]|nr:phosphate acyltransferase PlsX [Gammaproteobacteria bacterium]
MSRKPHIAVDAMGGDEGVRVMMAGVAEARRLHDGLQFSLFGDETRIKAALDNHPNLRAASEIFHCDGVVDANEKPAAAIRRANKTSMGLAIQAVKKGEAGAAVSAGNTGALMAIARFVLKTLPGIDRPALCTTLPALNGHTHMLDLGANLDCTAEHLQQFAIMGATLAEAFDNVYKPRVGLLNIGAEEIKGNEQVKTAGRLLEQSELNYIGFVEGNEIYSDTVDVVVCDGFVGNVALKTSEGVAKMIAYYLTQEFKRTLFGKLAGLMALPIIKSFRKRIDWRGYNGASLLGLKGIVIKSHGNADAEAFANAVEVAIIEARKNVPGMIAEHIEPHLRKENNL